MKKLLRELQESTSMWLNEMTKKIQDMKTEFSKDIEMPKRPMLK